MAQGVRLKHLDKHDRYNYRGIREGPSFTWPGDKGLALYIAMNLEHFAFGSQEGAKIAPPNKLDVLNYAWRDYGNRVGAWHLVELFQDLDLPAAVLCNTSILDYCPQLLDAWLDLDDAELVGHGYTNSERQGELQTEEESELIFICRERLQAHSGRPVKGWLSPWISESRETPDMLSKHGFEYTLNWAHDDSPTEFRVDSGKLLSIPYPQEINDIPTIVPNGATIQIFCEMIEAQFEELLERSKREPLVMGISLHPYIVGQPFRFYHLKRTLRKLAARRNEVWLTTPGSIAEYYRDMAGKK